MQWIKRSLRGTEVFARPREDGTLDVGADGRVEVKYQPGDTAKVYRAAERNLLPLADAPPASDDGDGKRPLPQPTGEATDISTDGACHGNPGPMGPGVVLTVDPRRA